MIETLFSVIGPVALIVAVGYGAVKTKLFPAEGVKYIMNYAQNFAVVLLLFNAVRNLDFAKIFAPEILAAYYIPAIAVFLLGVVAGQRLGRGPQSAVVFGFNALFANSVLLGLPICERAFGADSLSTNYLIIAFHSPFGYIVGAISMEIARPKAANWQRVFANIGRELIRNPLLIAIACGGVVNALGISLPLIVNDAIEMQARAAIPVALFGLGGVLTRLEIKGAIAPILTIASLRMIVHPALVLLVSYYILRLPFEIVQTLVLIAAMPTGVNGFIFASLYQREEEAAASIVFFGTLLAMLTLPAWLMLIARLA